MKVEIAQQWTAALRSGEYKQGTGKLIDGDKYCCLGVLCELAEKAGVIEREAGGIWPVRYADGDQVRTGVLPEVVREWAGMASTTGEFEDEYSNTLMGLNDGGHSFAEIAKVIDQHVAEL